MILVGIDDTDTEDSRGTNKLAKSLAADVADRFRCVRIVRHQLLVDPRVPYTSKNGSASLLFEPLADEANVDELRNRIRAGMLADLITGSDPGLCVVPAIEVPDDVVAFGLRCQSEVTDQSAARDVAERCGIPLEGLGGTEDGIIGALAAIGLATTGDDGRIVHQANWVDDLSGVHPIGTLHDRGVVVHDAETEQPIPTGTVDVGKKLRPNLRGRRAVLFVRRGESTADADYLALKLP